LVGRQAGGGSNRDGYCHCAFSERRQKTKVIA
jgi:hypothetical protein